MIISLLVAMDEGGGIGINGGLPWRLPDDLRRFKALTLGHHLLMGRKTYESIGKPLSSRTSIILSRNLAYRPAGCQSDRCWVVHSLAEGLALAAGRGEVEAFVIGGSTLFRAALPLAEQIYLTRVHARLPADVFFPPLDLAEWREIDTQTHPNDPSHPYAFTFSRLIRRKE
jgi:dihydrofolate reductase